MNNIKSKKIAAFISLTFLLTLVAAIVPQYSNAQHGKRTKVIVVKRPGHKVVVRKAHLRYHTLPRWGAFVNVRPANAILISGRNNRYYYNNGVYYTPRNNAYLVVRPSRGLRIKVLPTGHRNIVIGPRNYYYYYGTYYVKSAGDYVVVNPPEGALVDALPDGYEVKAIDGNEYYYLDGAYYAEVDAGEFDDGIGYQVVNF